MPYLCCNELHPVLPAGQILIPVTFGMMLLPGRKAGSPVPPGPANGSVFTRRKSFAILRRLTAIAVNRPDNSITAIRKKQDFPIAPFRVIFAGNVFEKRYTLGGQGCQKIKSPASSPITEYPISKVR